MKLLKLENNRFCEKRDYIKLSSIILSLMLIGIILFLPIGHAATSKDDGRYEHLKNWAKDILNNGTEEILNTINGSGTYSYVYSYVTGVDVFANQRDTNILYHNSNFLSTQFASFISILKYIAISWVVIMAAANLIKGMGDGRDGQELVLKFFFEICISGIIILNLDEIVPLLCSVITSLINRLDAVNISMTTIITDERNESLHNMPAWEAFLIEACGDCPKKSNLLAHFIWVINAEMTLMLPWIMSKILWIAGLFVLLQTLLEIGIRRVFLPFAVADIYNEGLRSPGARYIKKFIGAILKLGICILACKMSTVIGVQHDSGVQYAFNCIVINVVAIGVMFKAGEYTNDILGV